MARIEPAGELERQTGLSEEMYAEIARVRARQLDLLVVGERAISVRGWTDHGAYQHLAAKHAASWCDPKCLARIMYNHAIPLNQHRVRRHFGRLFNYTLDRQHQLIARERDHQWPHRISRFRLYSGANTGPEAEALELQLRQMVKRKELAEGRMTLALDLLAHLRSTP